MGYAWKGYSLVEIPQFDKPSKYQIQVEGVLDESWLEWLGVKSLKVDGNMTTLFGEVADQPALYGLILKLRDMGLNLLWVSRVEDNH